MNGFQDTSAFYGSLDKASAEDLLTLFGLAKRIRLRLGNKGYLLDNYLGLIFEGLSDQRTSDAVIEGGEACSGYRGLLRHVLEGTEPEEPHPLYGRVREVRGQHAGQLSFQERYTNSSLLMLFMADELMAYAVSEFVRKQNPFWVGPVDIVYLRKLHEEIGRLAGGACIEELDQRLRHRFQIAPKAAAFAQGFTDSLLDKLIWRDHETSRQIFQLLLDAMPDGREGA